ncbi:isoprenyl transferase [candidate division KSB1 bacterium]|nr:isoprenyl transferase [candidate division KSB1 bacterium]
MLNPNIPEHIAIIMDGNGRWARHKGLPRIAGHHEGVNSVREVVRAAGEWGIKILTLYTFSTENWNRPREEVEALMLLLLSTIRKEVNELEKNNVRLTVIGDLSKLPDLTRQSVVESIEVLKNNTGLILNLALNYGSRQEMLRAVRHIGEDLQHGKMKIEDIDDNLFSDYLYTASLPDPDLLIRTSGELRLSNFLLWQLAYTEIYVTEVPWPSFRKYEFAKAVAAFQERERRFGKTHEQLGSL